MSTTDPRPTAVAHLVRRMQADPRLAYLIGPGSEVWELVTEELAAQRGVDVKDLRREIEAKLNYEEWPSARPDSPKAESANDAIGPRVLADATRLLIAGQADAARGVILGEAERLTGRRFIEDNTPMARAA